MPYTSLWQVRDALYRVPWQLLIRGLAGEQGPGCSLGGSSLLRSQAGAVGGTRPSAGVRGSALERSGVGCYPGSAAKPATSTLASETAALPPFPPGSPNGSLFPGCFLPGATWELRSWCRAL